MKIAELLQDTGKVLADHDERTEQLHSMTGGAESPRVSLGGISSSSVASHGDRGIVLASLTNNRALLEDFANAGSVRRAELAAAHHVRLYSIIFALYRPGPAFRAGHAIADGALQARIAPGGNTWQEEINALNPGAADIFPPVLRSVSRQCVRLDRGTGEISGSGFLLNDGSVLTASHVVHYPGFLFQNTNRPGYVRYNQINDGKSEEAGVAAIYPAVANDIVRDYAIVAQSASWRELLAVSPLNAEFGNPPGLSLQTEPMSADALRNRLVAVIGHPVRGNQGGSITDIPGVFGDAALGLKRFMPGRIDATQPLVVEAGLTFIHHDCSTLGGASGACLVDLETGKVLGLHVAGDATLGNRAIPIWLLSEALAPRLRTSPDAKAVGGAPEAVPSRFAHEAVAPASTRKIIAYVMHEEEERLVDQTLQPGRAKLEGSRTMKLGEATDDEIETLRQSGILVEILPAPEAAIALEATSPLLDQIFSPAEMVQPQKFTLKIDGPLLPVRRNQLVACNVAIVEALPRNSYQVEAPPILCEKIHSLPFVRELTPERAPAGLALESVSPLEAGPPPGPTAAQKVFDLWLRVGVDGTAVASHLTQRGFSVLNIYGRKIRFLIPAGSAEIPALRRLPEIEVLDEFVPPKLHNDRARALLGLAVPGPRLPLPWNGSGEIVGIADTGIDRDHPDFAAAGKLVGVIALGRPGKTDDPHGHGTHVAGSVAGDGSASNGLFAGTAPGASIYVQSLLGPAVPGDPHPLTGLPSALGQLFDEAYAAGARIHNNSWGAVAGSSYRLSSREVDEYVATKRDLLIVISAGNEGVACDPPAPASRKSNPGFVDWYSLSAPATSKNALTVGASQSDLANVGHGRYTYATMWPDQFPLANLADEVASARVSGNPEELAGFSSRGPTDSLQVKPDVVAPGTDICSTRSSLAGEYRFSALNASLPDHYAHMCGTSMAAPLVSGCAAIARQYYRVVRNHPTPSAALIKATLINGARKLNGIHSTASPGGHPNGHQGFGRVDLAASLPNPANPEFVLEYFDNWQNPSLHLTDDTRQRFEFTLAAGGPLRICLAYTDLPGKMVQNTLVLHLHHLPLNRKYWGNVGQQAALAPALFVPDRNNNVSVIRIDSAPAGDYVIQVAPQNLPFGGAQDFALVMTGRITAFSPNIFND